MTDKKEEPAKQPPPKQPPAQPDPGRTPERGPIEKGLPSDKQTPGSDRPELP